MNTRLFDSAIVRKSTDLARQIPRAFVRFSVKQGSYQVIPPLIANSIPKSGTHLLKQILSAFPHTTYRGTFWASMPSFPFRERPKARLVAAIDALVPGELVPAHLYFEHDYYIALGRKNAVHFLIYRDPRDLVISEAFYLTHMNRWHKMHKFFQELGSDAERIMLAISGIPDTDCPYYYPNVAERYLRYIGWFSMENVFTVKFEDLISHHRETVIRRMVDFYIHQTSKQLDADEIVEKAVSSINPNRSHTFREGKAGRWREVLTSEHKEQLRSVAGDLLMRLGYEKDLSWSTR